MLTDGCDCLFTSFLSILMADKRPESDNLKSQLFLTEFENYLSLPKDPVTGTRQQEDCPSKVEIDKSSSDGIHTCYYSHS